MRGRQEGKKKTPPHVTSSDSFPASSLPLSSLTRRLAHTLLTGPSVPTFPACPFPYHSRGPPPCALLLLTSHYVLPPPFRSILISLLLIFFMLLFITCLQLSSQSCPSLQFPFPLNHYRTFSFPCKLVTHVHTLSCTDSFTRLALSFTNSFMTPALHLLVASHSLFFFPVLLFLFFRHLIRFLDRPFYSFLLSFRASLFLNFIFISFLFYICFFQFLPLTSTPHPHCHLIILFCLSFSFIPLHLSSRS